MSEYQERSLQEIVEQINQKLNNIAYSIDNVEKEVEKDLISLISDYKNEIDESKIDDIKRKHMEELKKAKIESLKRAQKKLIGLKNELCSTSSMSA